MANNWKLARLVGAIRSQSTAIALGEQNESPTLPPGVRPFEEIPGPRPIPILGNTFRYMPFVGEWSYLKFDQSQLDKYRKYGKLSVEHMISAPDRSVINVYDPDDIATVYRADTKYPIRPAFRSTNFLRSQDKNQFPNNGLLGTKDEEWHDVRTTSQRVMMLKQVVEDFVPLADVIAKDLAKRMKELMNDRGELEDIQSLVNRWGFESILYILVKRRLGLLSDNPEMKNIDKMIKAIYGYWKATHPLDYSMPFYLRFPYLSKWYMQFKRDHNYFYNGIIEMVREHQDQVLKDQDDKTSILSKLLKLMSPEMATVFSLDVLYAGVITSQNTLLGILRQLAENPEYQDKLRAEARQAIPEGGLLTPAALEKMPLIKAVLKETFRFHPLVAGPLRELKHDVILSGYHVPAGTYVVINHFVPAMQEEYFPEPQRFVPERWMRDTEESKTLAPKHGFAMLPFGFGPRMCAGRRLAELEMYSATTRILEQFDVEYLDDKPFDLDTYFVWLFKPPLKFRFTPRKQS